jgi:GT2 family glycosyltransferase
MNKVPTCGLAMGHAMLVRGKALMEVSAFDEAFLIYFEDIDFCLRFHYTG